MIEEVPEWAERRCNCCGYLDETDATFTIEGEDVCEGCYDAITSVSGDADE